MILSKAKTSLYASLSQRKMRRRHGLFVVEGSKSVADTFGSFPLEALVASESWASSHSGLMREAGGCAAIAPRQAIDRISSLSTSPEVLAVYRLPEPEPAPVSLPGDSLSLLVDGVQDPGNLGTLVRTAHWFGFTTVYASHETADIFNPKAIQASMGSLAAVRVIYCSLPELIARSGDIPVIGTLLDGDDIFHTALPTRGAIVLGNEGNGLSEAVRNLVTCPLLIPPYNKVCHGESLNVATAGAIVMALFRHK